MSAILYTNATTGQHGVILPHSTQVLYETEIDLRIQRVRNQIANLSKKQSNKATHGGKRHRARQLTNQDQLTSANQRLTQLLAAKELIRNQTIKTKPQPTLLELLHEKSIYMDKLEGYDILERSPYAPIFYQYLIQETIYK